MIIGIGVDIIRNQRFSETDDLSYLKRIFTESELNYCLSKKEPRQSLAVRFAGKEAVLKALSFLGKPDLLYNQIEILNNAEGYPSVELLESNFSYLKIFISLSHCEDYSIAYAVVEKDV